MQLASAYAEGIRQNERSEIIRELTKHIIETARKRHPNDWLFGFGFEIKYCEVHERDDYGRESSRDFYLVLSDTLPNCDLIEFRTVAEAEESMIEFFLTDMTPEAVLEAVENLEVE